MTPGERAYWADEVVKVTADAFDDVERRMLKTILNADSADQAWNAACLSWPRCRPQAAQHLC